jgi:uncharacterized protein with HEPN domain
MTAVTKKLLLDVQQSCEGIQNYCAGKTLQGYVADRQLRRATEREFEIIGEALNRLSRIDPETTAAISQLERIVGFRNRVIHGYDTIDDAVVWGVIEKYLPTLQAEVNSLLKTP